MSTPISAPAVIHLHTGYSTADRLRAPTNTPDIEKSAYSSCSGVVHKRKTSCEFNSSLFSNRRLVPYLTSFFNLNCVNSKEISSYRRINSTVKEEGKVIEFRKALITG